MAEMRAGGGVIVTTSCSLEGTDLQIPDSSSRAPLPPLDPGEQRLNLGNVHVC